MSHPHGAVQADVVSPESFVEQLEQEALEHRAVRHPLLFALRDGTLPDTRGALLDLVHQYLAYSSSFQRYLCGVIQQLPRLDHRTQLLHNLSEEAGHIPEEEAAELAAHGIDVDWVQGVPHPHLFRRFLTAVGMNEEWLARHPFCDEAEIWAESFALVTSTGGAARAVGALGVGTESIVKFIYRPLLVAMKRDLPVAPRDRVFFDLHALLDDEHGEVLNTIAVDLVREDPRQAAALRQGMLMSLNLRNAFFDTLHRRALAMPVAS